MLITACSDDDSNDSAPVCGNGVVEDGETCDDGNTIDGDGCSKNCQTESSDKPDDPFVAHVTPNPGPETACNDGAHEAGEVCDPIYSYAMNGDTKDIRRCIVTDEGKCVLESIEGKNNCGNGILDEGEECDDGNWAKGDGCSDKCKLEDANNCTLQNGSIGTALLVVDGDTLKLRVTQSNDGCKPVSTVYTIRMHGIDSPECNKSTTPSPIDPSYSASSCDPEKASDYSNKDKNEKGGFEAGEFVKSLVFSDENQGRVRIECETRSKDNALCLTDATNKRYLAYLSVLKDGKRVDLAEETLKAGYAMAYTDFTSQRTAAYCAAEKSAIDAQSGVWAYGASFENVVRDNFNEEKNSWLLSESHCK